MKTANGSSLKNFFLNLAKGLWNIIYNLSYHLFQQIIAIPKIIYATFGDLKTRIIIKKIGHIAKDDLIPLLLVVYAKDLIKKQASAYLEKNPSTELMSVNNVIKVSMLLLQGATAIYKIRKKTKMLFRTAVLSIEAGESINVNLRKTHPSPCIKENCSRLSFIKGTFRDIISYEAINLAISITRYIPVVGNAISKGLDSYHKGRYLVTVTLASLEVCSRHQEEYLKQYSELALAYGLIYFLLTELPSIAIQRYTGLPPSFYKATLQQLVLIVQVLMGKYINLPRLVTKSRRNLPDPVILYARAVGYLVDKTLEILQKYVPRWIFRQSPATIPWEKVFNSAQKFWNNKLFEKMRILFLPRMLTNKRAFIRDAVIPWNALRNKMIDTIQNIQVFQENKYIKAAAKRPKITAKTLWLIFGTPKALSELLLKLIRNQKFKDKLQHYRLELAHTVKEEAPKLPARNENRPPLRTQEDDVNISLCPSSSNMLSYQGSLLPISELNPSNEPSFNDEVNKKGEFDSEVLHNPNVNKSVSLPANNMKNLLDSIRNRKTTTLDPFLVLKKTRPKNRFFSDLEKNAIQSKFFQSIPESEENASPNLSPR